MASMQGVLRTIRAERVPVLHGARATGLYVKES